MARASGGRLLALLCAAAVAYTLVGVAVSFVAPPRASTATTQEVASTATAAGLLAAIPQSASALTDNSLDGWGPAEITAVLLGLTIPCIFFLEWEGKQEKEERGPGVAFLTKTIDGPPGDPSTYYRRSPESG
eukprot:TRINITY_DN1025_c0_g1_i10.p2 TRINITY_DN1025_c0_g1~~TRINITY_DN1025_c0_g1_i10.p2  ORF type:complete len:132 (-),score=34.16 TRINITY_DN1025_c0_g1_i10:90-485(-)